MAEHETTSAALFINCSCKINECTKDNMERAFYPAVVAVLMQFDSSQAIPTHADSPGVKP